MKRTFLLLRDSVSSYTRSKARKLMTPLSYSTQIQKDWVAASHVRNYMLNDPLVDWLKNMKNMKNNINKARYNQNTNKNEFTNFILKRGIEFEDHIVKYINENKTEVVTISKYFTQEGVEKTIESMKNGIPILHSAPVINRKENTGGVIDLLIRSDYLDKIVDDCPLTESEKVIRAPNLSGDYHYVVIDVKFSTLPLRSDGRHILNTGGYPAYKAQTLIYTQAVGKIQGYTPRYAYILGRKWKYTRQNVQYCSPNSFNKLGVIDFNGIDSDYITRTKNAINWVRDVKNFGHLWSLDPPTRTELYPNMCVDSGRWNKEKKKIANQIGEITSLWNCGNKHREIAFSNGITSWQHPECTSAKIGIKGVKSSVIDKMLAINKQNKALLWPEKIQSNIYGWKDTSNEVFVDFETISDIFAPFGDINKEGYSSRIFMIGVGWADKGVWKYKSFICKDLTREEELKTMTEFNTFLSERNHPKIYYWSAEKRIWNMAMRYTEYTQYTQSVLPLQNLCDLCLLFKNEPIVIKDCFKFGLKEVAASMRKHNMINTTNESDCKSGMGAMVQAWKFYNNPDDKHIMKQIEKYNEFDCKVLWEIISYLRENHA